MRRIISAGASVLLAAMFCACAGGQGGSIPGPGSPPAVQDARRAAAVTTSAAVNVLQDGGFESDTYTYWKQGGTSSASLQTSVVHTGSYAAKMGGTTTEPNGTAGVYQTVTVPAGGTLTFWIDELTNETSTKYADQETDIRDTSGNVLKNLYTDVGNGGTWVQRSYDVSAYAGQTVEIYFGVRADGASGYHIVQYIDDVSLTGTATPTPTATPTATPTGKPTASPTPTAKPTTTPTPKPTATPTPGSSLTVVTQPTVLSVISSGKNVRLSSYTLEPGGDLLNALVTAAKAGGSVTVDLPSDAFAQSIGVYQTDMQAATTLQNAGGKVTWDAGTQSPNPEPLHAKLAIVDGVGYLDGRNWDNGDVILRDTNANDLSTMSNALALSPGDGTNLDTIKQDALAMETAYIQAHTSGTLYFMTESFGAGNVANALLAAAQSGRTVHVIVLKSDLSSSEDTVLTQLQSAGADVELNPASGSEKVSIVGTTAWFGSSNATAGAAYQIDWGMNITDPTIVSALQSNFQSVLSTCTPYTAGS